ncbi:MAG: hypothetical protein APR62_13505 [Smithella sp. SDB]|nr:MAG: hypothetical protein APR62_13505 [Smithella sp. SDB]
MLNVRNYFVFIVIALIFYPLAVVAQDNLSRKKNRPVTKQEIQKTLDKDEKQTKQQIFTIIPQEINLGTITADESSKGIFTFKSISSDVVDWSTDGPSGWKRLENRKLSGTLRNDFSFIQVGVRLLPRETEDKQKSTSTYVEMKIESGSENLICRKEFQVGTHKATMDINSSDGQRTIIVTFTIRYIQENPLINLNPLRLDMGNVLQGKTVSKKIILSNSGNEMLTWSVAIKKHAKEDFPDDFHQGKYISFVNEEVRGSGVYNVPANLKEKIELMGQWKESNGYPTGAEGENFIKVNFSGTGIVLYLATYQEDEVNMAMSIDKSPVDNVNLLEDLEKSKGELLIAEDLADGPHVFTIASKNSCLVFEGVKILGGNTVYFPEGSIRIVPNSGATTRQTNYITVSFNAGQTDPGYYVDDIVFDTNSGEALVEVFVEVLPETVSKIVDIYRYYNGTDYMFTADPQAEAKRLIQNRYVKEGIAFRLFKPEVPGTVSFYRWYNPQKKSHFYHYDSNGGGKDLRGYVFEGTMGNIATSKLTNTRELYRWYNLKTGHYFYSTDLQGGKIDKKIYKFDGIAGYVK